MKTVALFCSILFAVASMASTLTVNTPYASAIENSKKVSISGTPTVAAAAVTVLSAEVVFTIPDEQPSYDDDDVKTAKLAFAVDSNTGTILIADAAANNGAGGWEATTVQTDEETPIAITAEGKVVDGRLHFSVSLNDSTTKYEVVSPASDTKLSAVETVGEGDVKAGMTLALVDTAIVPGSADAPQTPEMVINYVEWLNADGKGKAMTGASKAELADAFAMNAGGTPALQIVDLNVAEKTITVKGTYATASNSVVNVDMGTIHGTLYVSYATDLSDAPTVVAREIDVESSDTSLATIDLGDILPDDAAFVKATVALSAPVATTSL